jgi:hypothetical protein
MRKALLALLTFILAIGSAAVLSGVYLRRDNAHRVKRAQEVVDEIERLEIAQSDHIVADAIAAKFGIAPPPYWLKNRYNREDCAASDHLEHCTYILLMNNSPVESLLQKHQSMPRFGISEWWGNAQISIVSGMVRRYSFWVWYRASNGRWRGFGADVSPALPRFEQAQRRISDSYSVRRIEMKFGKYQGKYESGLGLETSLTPTASAEERKRALHIDFSCLSRGRGCGEVCEVMPEAWKDFYQKLGHFDAESLAPDCLLSTESPK